MPFFSRFTKARTKDYWLCSYILFLFLFHFLVLLSASCFVFLLILCSVIFQIVLLCDDEEQNVHSPRSEMNISFPYLFCVLNNSLFFSPKNWICVCASVCVYAFKLLIKLLFGGWAKREKNENEHRNIEILLLFVRSASCSPFTFRFFNFLCLGSVTLIVCAYAALSLCPFLM